MEFKRLNNMTGSDPVMNRRITSIFLHDLEAFKTLFTSLSQQQKLDHIKFSLHKIKPSLVIFEMGELINQYEDLLQIAQKSPRFSDYQEKLNSTIKETELQIGKVKVFLSSL